MHGVIRKFTLRLTLVTGLLMASGRASLAGPMYHIIDLGTLGGTSSFAYGLNERGQVVGEAAVSSGARVPFLWENGVMTNLGTLGGSAGRAYDVNEHGVVVGRAANSSNRLRPFVMDFDSNGTMQEIPPLPGAVNGSSTTHGSAFGINEGGIIAGYGYNPAAQYQTFSSDGATTTPVPLLGGSNSRAWHINDSGQISGWGRDASNAIVGYRWTPGLGIELIGNLIPGADVFAVGINNAGYVTGAIQKDFGHQTPGINAQSRSFIWDGISLIDIGLVPGYAGSAATLINDHGSVVGQAFNFDVNGNPISPTAFLYSGGVNYDLNQLIDPVLGWHLTYAYDINSRGQIVGQGRIDGQAHAFLMTPVPEPGSLFLVGSGILSLMFPMTRRRQHRNNRVSS